MRKGKVKRILSRKVIAGVMSAAMIAGMGINPTPVQAVENDAAKTISIDFSKTDGEMIPKTGWLLMPNENIPDGRIIPLNTKDVRDDIDTQNLLGNNGNGNSQGQLQDVLPNEGNRLARIKHGVERMKELGIDNYYPIMGYMPSWISSNGMPQGTPKDYALWKQWVKDIVQYMKDNDLDVTEYNVWNENWSISVDNFNKMYEQAWHAGREVMPESKMIGPSPGSDNAGVVQSLADYCEEVGITLDIVSWHFGNYSNLPGFQQGLEDYISQKSSLGEPKYYYEEYTSSGDVGNMQKEFTILANYDRADVDAAIRGIWTYVNGLSDQLITVQNNENPYQRRNIWWMMTAYGAMSGTRVKQEGDDLYVASYDEDKGEAKVLIGGQQGSVDINLENFPFAGENVKVNKYKITDIENDGLQYQGSDEAITAGDTVTTNINFESGDVWLIEVKKDESIPSDFALKGPDDGLAADAVGRKTVGTDAGFGAGGAESRVSGDVLRSGDAPDALFGLVARVDDLVASGDEDDLPGSERHGSDAVSDHVEPVERSLGGDCVYARDEEVGHQGLAADFEPFGAGHRGVETVEQRPVAVRAEPFDDSSFAHCHRVSEGYDLRGFGPDDGPDLFEGLLRGCDDVRLEMVAAQRFGARMEFFTVCHGCRVCV